MVEEEAGGSAVLEISAGAGTGGAAGIFLDALGEGAGLGVAIGFGAGMGFGVADAFGAGVGFGGATVDFTAGADFRAVAGVGCGVGTAFSDDPPPKSQRKKPKNPPDFRFGSATGAGLAGFACSAWWAGCAFFFDFAGCACWVESEETAGGGAVIVV